MHRSDKANFQKERVESMQKVVKVITVVVLLVVGFVTKPK